VSSDGTAGTPPIPRALLAVLLLRCAGEPGEGREFRPDAADPVFRAFRDAVEADFAHHHSVSHYARLLGYDARTLSRATGRAAGITPKAFIDQRVTLEAKRLLAHSGLSAARCAQRLGFDDPANFAAYFKRATGQAPGAWRRRYSPEQTAEGSGRQPR
jgi:AraC family transcriptional regulator, transcriptional activator of pobA